MSSEGTDFETRLREALSPVDPPADLAERMELTLVKVTELAHDELESWELSAMRDPRNWVRPVVAAVIGASAGTALVLLRLRMRHRGRKPRSSSVVDAAGNTLRDFANDARRVLPDRLQG
jgi:hypothetical protein